METPKTPNSHTTYCHDEPPPAPYTATAHPGGYLWQPGFVHRAPWGALSALFLAVICAAISAAIIVISNQQVATWRIQPSVILGFLASLAAAMLVISLSSGVAITWWRSTLDLHGTTLAKLENIWNYGPIGGSGASGAWFAGRHVNKVAVASVLTAIASIAYSPLLQRASHFEATPISTNSSLSLAIRSILPDGYAGTVDYTSHANTTVNGYFAAVIQNWWNGVNPTTLDQPGYACNDSCTGWVLSAGLGYSCSSTQETVDLPIVAAVPNFYGFSTNFTRYDNDNSIPTLEVTVSFIQSVTEFCAATLVTNVCQIQSGTVNFPVEIQNTTISPNELIFNITNFVPYTSIGDMSTAKQGDPAGPLAALEWFGFQYLRANTTIRYDNVTNYYSEFASGVLALQSADTGNDFPPNSNCPYQFIDPTQNILNSFNEVLFLAAIDADWTPQTIQTFPVVQTTNSLVYTSVYPYLAVASVILVIAILAISTTLYGWWDLGRDVSLSPLETAKAFGAPIFQHWNLHMDSKHLARDMGQRKFMYSEKDVTEDDGIARPMLQIAELNIGNQLREPQKTRLPGV
jgi:hypothetical protein